MGTSHSREARWHNRLAPLLVAASAAIALLLLPAAHSPAHVVLALTLTLALLATFEPALGQHSAGLHGRNRQADRQEREHLEQRLEELRDVVWELRDNETRYREVLDSQADIIFRRAHDGRLTFVNTAFCRLFDVEAQHVLGTPFEPVVLAQEAPGSSPRQHPLNRRTELVETSNGPRWLALEEQRVRALAASDAAEVDEVQTFGRDVTAERAFQDELARARDDAQTANRAKSRFLAAMSHEIRTPMNGIMGMTSLILDTSLTAEQRTYARAIDQSARTLLLLIDEILDFSKIEAGKLYLVAAPFALEDCVESTIELMAPSAHEKGLELAWIISHRVPRRVIGDAARIRQILLNLLGNAIKFTDRGGVLVSVDCDAPAGDLHRLLVKVKDTGIGIDLDRVGALFSEFGQAEDGSPHRRGGTGLGLAISRRLARAMGGDIEVESKPGRGATFIIRLALPAAADAAPADAQSSQVDINRSVLLALDRAIERRAIAAGLRNLGVNVVEADSSNAEQEVTAAAATALPIDTVIVDARADPGQAATLLARARALRPERMVRGVLLIDAVARASLKPFRAAGFESYLVRPVRPRSLVTYIAAPRPRSGSPEATRRDSKAQRATSLRIEGCRVLLAEDNAVNALLARRMLEKVGCTVVHVVDGVAAVDAVRRMLEGDDPPFDVVLMDLHMPRLGGIEATAELRSLVARSTGLRVSLPPIVALTANAFPEDRQRCLAAGLDDYLAKPFDRHELLAMLERWRARAMALADPSDDTGTAA